jgi:hypothetical protein
METCLTSNNDNSQPPSERPPCGPPINVPAIDPSAIRCTFPDEEQKLRDSKAVKGFHRVRIGAYWIELMVAGLIRSAREIRNGALLD